MKNMGIILIGIALIAVVLFFVFGKNKIRWRGIFGGKDFGFETVNPNLQEGGFLNPR